MLSIFILGVITALGPVQGQHQNFWNRPISFQTPAANLQPTAQPTFQARTTYPAAHQGVQGHQIPYQVPQNTWNQQAQGFPNMFNMRQFQPAVPNQVAPASNFTAVQQQAPAQGTPIQAANQISSALPGRLTGAMSAVLPAAMPGGMPGCVPTFYQPLLCQINGENQHQYTLQAVMRMLGSKNIESVGQCIRGVQKVNCADYNAAQFIWKKGYCYCKRYHKNLSSFTGMPPLRCVLNNCGGCSQDFYLGRNRIVDCD